MLPTLSCIYLHYHPHHVPIPLSASRGKSGHVTMLPESCLSKQGVKKARTGITGWCSLTVRRLHSSQALSRSLVSLTLPPCPHFSRVFHHCHQSPCSLCHLQLWCRMPATPLMFYEKLHISPPQVCSSDLVTFRKSQLTKPQKFLTGPYLRYLMQFDTGSWWQALRGRVLLVSPSRLLVSTHFPAINKLNATDATYL